MADFDARPTFRVRDTGQLLVCKCRCTACAVAAQTDDVERHCEGCSIGRAFARQARRNEVRTAALAAHMEETMGNG